MASSLLRFAVVVVAAAVVCVSVVDSRLADPLFYTVFPDCTGSRFDTLVAVSAAAVVSLATAVR